MVGRAIREMTEESLANSSNTQEIWQALQEVKDPEIPVISVVEMGIIRNVDLGNERVTVTMTPTFSGCPAMTIMQHEIAERVRRLGYKDVNVEVALYPPWRSDWISTEGRQRLKEFGIAPPRLRGERAEVIFFDLAVCPYCDSKNTTLKNDFGSTLCRSIYYCESCHQPFEQFKVL